MSHYTATLAIIRPITLTLNFTADTNEEAAQFVRHYAHCRRTGAHNHPDAPSYVEVVQSVAKVPTSVTIVACDNRTTGTNLVLTENVR